MRRGRHERKRKLSLFRLINRLLFLGIGISLLFALLRVQDMDEDLPTFMNHGLRVQSSDLPKVSVDDWELTLINRSHLQEESHPKLTKIDDIQVDSRIAENTRQFLAAARAIAPGETLISGYRSRAEQTELYEEALALAEEEGLSRQEVQKRIQLPGASEHQTGLAIDMSEPEGQNDEVANKIAEIAPKYGFILRYPEGKSDITGVDFENWHYRYVGLESAQYMQKHHLVLEEYLALLKESDR
ncbi:M15 family metallopeptidase [Streptococcus cristatus]|uniref:D-alanyl-D-alanine carboxypeptidase n=1 Tax=Streptococcus cristatus TaxID=45634 RepID=A0A139N3U1_STRCR|nr:D-alanyl-D-alanine carboxypeptidase [Streptococcus cristatus]